MILYHGTSGRNARKIMKQGFTPGLKYNWHVQSKPGFVYLSLGYAPFYAMYSTKNSVEGAIIKVEVDEKVLYPEDDFIMAALKKPRYTQDDLDRVDLNFFKQYASDSLKFLGNACAKPEDIKIVGCTYFDMSKLLYVCDPVISSLNYQIMGDYYRKLTEWIYEGNKPEDFRSG